VSSCADSGIGSLRQIVNAPTTASGDTIDMTMLDCSTISLQTGAIYIIQDDLTIKGPGSTKLEIRAKYSKNGHTYYDHDRVFNHNGLGTLKLYNFKVSAGYVIATGTTDAAGGCILSHGNLELTGMTVASCGVQTDSGSASGGAVSAYGSLK